MNAVEKRVRKQMAKEQEFRSLREWASSELNRLEEEREMLEHLKRGYEGWLEQYGGENHD